MSEENNFEKEESSSQAQSRESLHADKPSKRAVEMVDEIRTEPATKLAERANTLFNNSVIFIFHLFKTILYRYQAV